VSPTSDPINGTTNPKSIPGSVQLYNVRVTNQGSGPVDNNAVVIVDPFPPTQGVLSETWEAPAPGLSSSSNGFPARADVDVHRAQQHDG
jgi:hypothetical protein